MTARTRAELLAAITPLVPNSWTDEQLTDFIDSALLSTDAGAVLHVDRLVTDAELRDLGDAPIELVPTPGSGFYIAVVDIATVADFAVAYTLNDPNDVPALSLTGDVYRLYAPFDSAGTSMRYGVATNPDSNPVWVEPNENQALMLVQAGAPITDGDPANTYSIRVYYRIEHAAPFGA